MKMLENPCANTLLNDQNYMYMYLSLDEIYCNYCAVHSLSFLIFTVRSVEVPKENGCQIFINGDQPAKVV